MRIDLTEVRNVLATVDRMLSAHHGQDVPGVSTRPGVIRLKGPATSALADDLLVVQDYLRLADAELTALYWMSQGREDPRRPGGPARDTNSRRGTSPSQQPLTLTR